MRTATSKRLALKATTAKEKALAKAIARSSGEDREALLDGVTNMWVIELAEIFEEEAAAKAVK